MEKTSKRLRKAEEKQQPVKEQFVSKPSEAVTMAFDLSPCCDRIVSFLDIPSLGKCAQVSKQLKEAVMKDSAWEHHLVELLQKVYDHAFYVEPKERRYCEENNLVPMLLSKRPLKSTNFRAWYMEWNEPPVLYYMMMKSSVKGYYERSDGKRIRVGNMKGSEKFFHWLVKDVPLRDYYKESGHFAWRGLHEDIMERIDEGGDPYAGSYDYDGVYLGVNHDMFEGLPNLRLFHGQH